MDGVVENNPLLNILELPQVAVDHSLDLVGGVLNVAHEGGKEAVGFFTREIRLFKDWSICPFDALIGTGFIFAILINVKIFITTFREFPPHVSAILSPIQNEWDKVGTRVISSINTLGSVARFLDWGGDRGYFVFGAVNAVFFKVIGSFTGVINFTYRSIQLLQEIEELERITKFGESRLLAKKGELDACWYATYASFMANFNFMIYSGVQLSGLLLGTIVAVEISSMILAVATTMLIVSLVFQMTDSSAQKRDLLKIYDREGQQNAIKIYSFVRNWG